MKGLTLLVGDCRETLRTLPADSVDCCVTSPPYWNLRAYGGGARELGREGTAQGYVQNLVDVFAEVRRVLKPTSTCWLNLGDCYGGSGKGPSGSDNRRAWQDGRDVSVSKTAGRPKDLMMVPNRVAIALQDDGWFVRSEVVWAKKGGGMPESVRNRPSASHEKIWLLTKRGSGYFYDPEASALPVADTTIAIAGSYARRLESGVFAYECKYDGDEYQRHKAISSAEGRARHMAQYATQTAALDKAIAKLSSGGRARGRSTQIDGAGRNNADIFERERARLEKLRHRVRRADAKMADVPGHTTHSFHAPGATEYENGLTRRLRNYEPPVEVDVWEMGTAGFPGAHFACFPKVLVERCLTAGCPPGGSVLDPFGGAGTTGLVAIGTGRSAILCKLNAEYAEMARKRIESGGRLDTDMRRQAAHQRMNDEMAARGQRELFDV